MNESSGCDVVNLFKGEKKRQRNLLGNYSNNLVMNYSGLNSDDSRKREIFLNKLLLPYCF